MDSLRLRGATRPPLRRCGLALLMTGLVLSLALGTVDVTAGLKALRRGSSLRPTLNSLAREPSGLLPSPTRHPVRLRGAASSHPPNAAEDINLLRSGVQAGDELEVRVVQGGPLITAVAGHLALVIRRGGRACSFGFYPSEYRDQSLLIRSFLWPAPAALVWPDPILRKAHGRSEPLGRWTVGADLADVINQNLLHLHPMDGAQAAFAPGTTHRLPLEGHSYAVHGAGPPAFNCASFVARFVPSIRCPWNIPRWCRVVPP
jgi:hypothetical protein